MLSLRTRRKRGRDALALLPRLWQCGLCATGPPDHRADLVVPVVLVLACAPEDSWRKESTAMTSS